MSHTIYAAKFRDDNSSTCTFTTGVSTYTFTTESQSYCNKNIVFACFNCTSHIINFGYVDYFQ